MVAAPRCNSKPNSQCCPCMKNGRCVRCRCVKSGTSCVDCWPSVINPSRCENRQPICATPVSVPDVSDCTETQSQSQSQPNQRALFLLRMIFMKTLTNC